MRIRRVEELFPGSVVMPQVYLKPAELYIAWKPALITTLLGSCISVVLFLPASKVTAVCHAMLPSRRPHGADETFRYVDSSIEYMLDALKINQNYMSVRIKVFGGADVIGSQNLLGNGSLTVGRQNIIAARQTLINHGLSTELEKVGGRKGYKIFVRSDTGQVRLRYLSNTLG